MNYFHREVIGQTSEHGGVLPFIVFKTNLIPLIKHHERKGVGITTLLCWVLREEPDLVGVPFEPPNSFSLTIAWKKEAVLSQAHRAFVAFLLKRGKRFPGKGMNTQSTRSLPQGTKKRL